jgi:hypothetical protein
VSYDALDLPNKNLPRGAKCPLSYRTLFEHTSLLLHDIFRGSMKDECISNSSTQQPSPVIQSSSPTPTLLPSHLSSSPSSQVPTVQSNDDDTSSVTTEGPTADASIPPTDDVSKRNELFMS